MQKGRVMKLIICAAALIFIDGLFHCPVLRAMPRFLEWYEASPNALAEWKGKCTLCHVNQDGRGPLNEFGQAFADHGFRFTPELAQAFPDRFAGVARPEVAAAKPTVDAKEIFMRDCAACHGEDGKGTLPNVPDWTDAQWQRKVTDAQMTATIKTGKGLMPGWKDQLSDEAIAALVKYVRGFGKK
ncbi:MAG: c-type cytochrome [Acidobacteriota bacterium]|nr:c-type cytochrome [Blastocatellia bacterium]MDW8239793.1 c-type cytochrome [Acidobacteriota bacterium]